MHIHLMKRLHLTKTSLLILSGHSKPKHLGLFWEGVFVCLFFVVVLLLFLLLFFVCVSVY